MVSQQLLFCGWSEVTSFVRVLRAMSWHMQVYRTIEG